MSKGLRVHTTRSARGVEIQHNSRQPLELRTNELKRVGKVYVETGNGSTGPCLQKTALTLPRAPHNIELIDERGRVVFYKRLE